METLEGLADDMFNVLPIFTCSIFATFYVFLVATTGRKNPSTFVLLEESIFLEEILPLNISW